MRNNRPCAYHFFSEQLIDSFGCWGDAVVDFGEDTDESIWIVRTEHGLIQVVCYRDDMEVDATWLDEEDVDDVARGLARMREEAKESQANNLS